MSNNNNGRFFMGALFGASIAAIAALLYAPKSGKELREDLAQEIDELKFRAGEYADIAVERGVEMFDQAHEMKDDIQVNLKQSASHLKSQFQDVRDEATDEWHKLKADAKSTREHYQKESKEFYDNVKEEAKRFGQDVKAAGEVLKDDAEKFGEDIKLSGEVVADSAKESVENIKDKQ